MQPQIGVYQFTVPPYRYNCLANQGCAHLATVVVHVETGKTRPRDANCLHLVITNLVAEGNVETGSVTL